MSGIEFNLPYLGQVHLRPQIFHMESAFGLQGESFYNQGLYTAALVTYKKSLILEVDHRKTRNNIASCLLLLGDRTQAYRTFKKTADSSLISIFNVSLASASVNLPEEGLKLLKFPTKDPVLNLLKAILYHLNNEPINSFQCIAEYKQNKGEVSSILMNLRRKVENVLPSLPYSRTQAKLEKTVSEHMFNFLCKVNNRPVNLSATYYPEEENEKNETFQPVIKVHKSKHRESSSMILKNSKLILKRMIDPPQHRKKVSSPVGSIGFNCKDSMMGKKFLDTGNFKAQPINSHVGPLDIEVDIDLENYTTLPQQSLDFICTYFNAPNRNIKAFYILLKNLRFFKRHKSKIVKKFIRVATYKKYEKDEIILKEGEVGTYINIILSGSVIVVKKLKGTDDQTFVVGSAYDGEVIGDYSFVRKVLDSKPSLRTATCIAAETCHILRIENSDISEIFEKSFDIKNKYLEFIKALPLFSDITPIDLALLSNTITCQQYEMDSCVLAANSVPDKLFIVYLGRVRIKYPAKKANYSEVLKTVQYSTVTKEISINSGNFFGQRALLGNKTPANFTVTSDNISFTSILFISREDFQQLFLPIQQILLQKLKNAPEFDLKVPDEYAFL